jgi:DNA repair exonuclease SbcCD ATPase subunit
MKILAMIAENFKRVRVVEIDPKGRMVIVSGRNGQGKTSVLDAVWAGLVGKRAMPEKPVRKGAEKAKITLGLGDDKITLQVTRTIAPDGMQTLTVEKGKGNRLKRPQELLDELLGELSFAPLAFVAMKPKEQIELLRKVAKIDVDLDALTAANTDDYDERTNINRDGRRLATELAAMLVQDGLPKAKLDEAPLLAVMAHASALNAEAQAKDRAKIALGQAAKDAQDAEAQGGRNIGARMSSIAQLTKALADAEAALKDEEAQQAQLRAATKKAVAAHEAAPAGVLVDVTTLATELEQVRLMNREIDKRERRTEKEKELCETEQRAATLTRRMEQRMEEKRAALGKAKMPVEGLSFDENAVTMNGIPLEQLGEAEQMRVSALIAMAANPTLRVMRIEHGESMDEESMAALAALAEEHDFQIWISRVDSTGKVGIVMEDGMVKTENDGEAD